jgi:hypothetical protein
MGLHCGVDLHGNNGYYGVVDEGGRRVLGRRLPNDPVEVLKLLEPYRERLVEVVVESTFNWYRYLCWAFIEAANFMRRYCPEAKAWYQRKLQRSKVVVATKALAAKIAMGD